MGQVIPWPKPENRPARPTRDMDGPTGRILLFLGVRYERQDAEPSARGVSGLKRAPRPIDSAPATGRGPAKGDRPQRRRRRG